MARDDRRTFEQVKEILKPYESRMSVAKDDDTEYYLNTGRVCADGYAIFFGAVRRGKAYVSYHLMPLYTNPELQARVPDVLKPRKQGKTCFNFRSVTEEQVQALAELTKACAEQFERPGMLDALAAMRERRK
jgi:hypothetical protein